MHFKFVVALVLSGVILVTDAAPVESQGFVDEQVGDKDLLKNLKDEIIHEDRAAFLNRHQDVFKTISLADIEESDFTAIDKNAGPNVAPGPDSEPADEKPTTGAFQADMMLTNEQVAEINEILDDDDDDDDDSNSEDQSTRRSKRKAVTATKYHWPLAVVMVEFNLDTAEKKTNAIKAMVHWMEHTCLLFVHYSENVANQLGHSVRLNLVGNRDGCWSYVGKVYTSRQTVSIGAGCQNVGTIIHELGHAIGFHHEQSRPDRDGSITVHYNNIESGKENNFKKYSWESVASHGVPYDLSSIMHYGAYGFSWNGQKTITTNDPSKQSLIGQREVLSAADIQMANNMYECHKYV